MGLVLVRLLFRALKKFEFSLFQDGDNYVISSTQDGTDYNSVLTLKDVEAGATYDGSYYCTAVYTDPSYISITATDQTTFTVVGMSVFYFLSGPQCFRGFAIQVLL